MEAEALPYDLFDPVSVSKRTFWTQTRKETAGQLGLRLAEESLNVSSIKAHRLQKAIRKQLSRRVRLPRVEGRGASRSSSTSRR